MKRRKLLSTLGASIVALPGCLGQPSSPSDSKTTPGRSPSGDAVRWTYQTGGSVRHRPTLQDGIDYGGGGTNDRASGDRESSENVYALTADDGSEQWRYETAAGVASSLVAREGVYVVVGWNAGTHGIGQRLVRIDDGSETWTTESYNRYLHLLDVTDGIVYLGTSDDANGFEGEKLFAVQTNTGDQRWSVEAGDTTNAVHSGDTLYAVEGGRRTTAFAVSDGSERWHRDMHPGGVS